MVMNFRNNYARLAESLYQKGETEKAIKVLDKCINEFPSEVVSLNYFSIPIIDLYHKLGETKKGNEVLVAMIDNQLAKIKYLKEFSSSLKNSVVLDYEIVNKNINKDIFEFIKEFSKNNLLFNNFVNKSKHLTDLNCGGNISFKTKDGMFISSSGANISDIDFSNNFNFLKKENNKLYTNEGSYISFLNKINLYNKNNMPSIETGIHLSTKYNYTLHIHPFYTTAILCSNNSHSLIKKLFKKDFNYINFKIPGYKLSNFFYNASFNSKVIFLVSSII